MKITKNLNNTIEFLTNDTYKQISTLGSFQFFIIVILILYFTLDIYNAFFLALCFIIAKLITIPIRLYFFKERPNKIKHNNTFFEKVKSSSMPSLHAVRITILLLFFIQFFNYQIFITTFLIILTSLVIYSRIYKKRHYPIDLFIGIIIGIFTFYICKLIFNWIG